MYNGVGSTNWAPVWGVGVKYLLKYSITFFDDVMVMGISYIFSIELVLVICCNLEPNIQQVIKYFVSKVTILEFHNNFWVLCKCLLWYSYKSNLKEVLCQAVNHKEKLNKLKR
jgi:hypothetical protein